MSTVVSCHECGEPTEPALEIAEETICLDCIVPLFADAVGTSDGV